MCVCVCVCARARVCVRRLVVVAAGALRGHPAVGLKVEVLQVVVGQQPARRDPF